MQMLNFPYFLLVVSVEFFQSSALAFIGWRFCQFCANYEGNLQKNATFVYKTLLGQAALNASLFAGTSQEFVNRWPKGIDHLYSHFNQEFTFLGNCFMSS